MSTMQYEVTKKQLLTKRQYTWLITGVAGFIGSNLMQELLLLNQKVIGLDDLSTGHKRNIEEVLASVSDKQQRNFVFYKANICCKNNCKKALKGVDYVLHQAVLGSVPQSIEDPVTINHINVDGFINILLMAKEAKVKRFVYASSCSVYGNDPKLPKTEDMIINNLLSPYAVSKMTNELYAQAFANCYGIEVMGLRYFNVFGPRQDPTSHYAAVIPMWILSMLKSEPVFINGDGETSRDFCYVADVVKANILAALIDDPKATNTVYNIGMGESLTLNELFFLLRDGFDMDKNYKLTYKDYRVGDIRHSRGDITRAIKLLGYRSIVDIKPAMLNTIKWYKKNFSAEQ